VKKEQKTSFCFFTLLGFLWFELWNKI